MPDGGVSVPARLVWMAFAWVKYPAHFQVRDLGDCMACEINAGRVASGRKRHGSLRTEAWNHH